MARSASPISLFSLIFLPTVTLIMGAVSWVSFFAYRNEEAVATQTTERIAEAISQQIKRELERFFEQTAREDLQQASVLEQLPIGRSSEWARLLAVRLRASPELQAVAIFPSAEEGLVLEELPDNHFALRVLERRLEGQWQSHSLDERLRATKLTGEGAPEYLRAITRGKDFWEVWDRGTEMAIAGCLAVARWLSRPLQSLSRESEAIVRGERGAPLKHPSAIAEVRSLEDAFRRMAQDLHRKYQDIETEVDAFFGNNLLLLGVITREDRIVKLNPR